MPSYGVALGNEITGCLPGEQPDTYDTYEQAEKAADRLNATWTSDDPVWDNTSRWEPFVREDH
jgi:hypothetical protein